MVKRSSLNVTLLIFSIFAAIIVFVLGEVILGYLYGLPYFIQTAIYLTFVTVLLFLAVYLSEKINSGYYIPRGRITFDGTCAKAAAILVPCALAIGLLTQLLYGFLGTSEITAIPALPGQVVVGGQSEAPGVAVGDVQFTQWEVWWDVSGNDTPMPAYKGLSAFFVGDGGDNQFLNQDLHTAMDAFAADVLGPDATFERWLEQRRLNMQGNAPSFMDVGGGEIGLAFQAAVEYSYVEAIAFTNFELFDQDNYVFMEPVLIGSYRGLYGREFVLFWEALNLWTREHPDPCNTFYQFWRWHIADAPLPRAPMLVILYESPHLIVTYDNPGDGLVLRIILRAVLLSLWGVFTGVATCIFLNNDNLFKRFLFPRIIVSVVIATAVAILLSQPGLGVGVLARGLMALATCLLYLPTYNWGAYGQKQYGGQHGGNVPQY